MKFLVPLFLLLNANVRADLFAIELTDVYSNKAGIIEVCGVAQTGKYPAAISVTRNCPPESTPKYFTRPKTYSTLTDDKGNFCLSMPETTDGHQCQFSGSLLRLFD